MGQLCERSHGSNSMICTQNYELIVRSVGIPDSIHAIRFWPRRLCSGSSSCEVVKTRLCELRTATW